MRTSAAATLLVAALVAAGPVVPTGSAAVATEASAPSARTVDGRDFPTVRQVVRRLPALAGVHRRFSRRVELRGPRDGDPGAGTSCGEGRINGLVGVEARYGDGGGYVDIAPLTARVYRTSSRAAATSAVAEVRRSVRGCVGTHDEWGGYGEATVREVPVPRRLGTTRFGYRVYGPFQAREVRVVTVKGRHLVEVVFDGDVPEDPDRTWSYKYRSAFSGARLVRGTVGGR